MALISAVGLVATAVAASSNLWGVSPQRMGTGGGALLLLKGAGLYTDGNRAVVWVGPHPCETVHERTDPRGSWLACRAPAAAAGVYKVWQRPPSAAALSCDACTVSYEAELVPSFAFGPHPLGAELVGARPHHLQAAEGDAVTISVSGSARAVVDPAEQLHVRVGGQARAGGRPALCRQPRARRRSPLLSACRTPCPPCATLSGNTVCVPSPRRVARRQAIAINGVGSHCTSASSASAHWLCSLAMPALPAGP